MLIDHYIKVNVLNSDSKAERITVRVTRLPGRPQVNCGLINEINFNIYNDILAIEINI